MITWRCRLERMCMHTVVGQRASTLGTVESVQKILIQRNDCVKSPRLHTDRRRHSNRTSPFLFHRSFVRFGFIYTK